MLMKHQPSPSMNAPSTSASNAPTATDAAGQNPRGNSCIIDLPNFQSESVDGDLSGEAAVASSSTSEAAAVPTSAPGMALTQEHNSEPFFIPSFLHCARSAHDGIKPDVRGEVISNANRNIEETRCVL